MKNGHKYRSKRVQHYPVAQLASTLMLVAVAASSASAETLQQYAAKCDAAMGGVTVPTFNCDAGTLVPTTDFGVPTANIADGCDRPNQLNQVCDPLSRFQVLARTPTVDIVAHCRKKGLAAGHYGDIVVIQTNKQTGATCFYQSSIADMDGRLVKAPSQGESVWSPTATPASHWFSPPTTASIACAACHDNGAIIRSPYLAQITGPNALPGAGDNTYNRDQPYHFIGADFAAWKTYKVNVPGNLCVACHRMGASNLGGGGTALDFGLRATAPSQRNKNPHSSTSPIWMRPGQIFYSQASGDAAAAIDACARRKNEIPLPNDPGCQITPLSTTITPLPAGNLQFSAATYSVNEGSGGMLITVTRTGGSTGQVSVNYTTRSGTATEGADYTFTSGFVTWASGDTVAKTFRVPIIDGADIEGTETVNLSLSNANGGAGLGTPSTAVLTIIDNDIAATCAGRVATIVRTGFNTQIFGTPRPDVILDRGGNNMIFGLAGNDLICGGPGNDIVNGGDGNDQLFGGPGNDTVNGNAGFDQLNGNQDLDRCNGGPPATGDTAKTCEQVSNVP